MSNFKLEKIDQKLHLMRLDSPHGIAIDFISEAQLLKKQKISAKTDLLSRAVGGAKEKTICDLTLGLAGDAFHLCYLGAKVYGVEQHPFIFALVEDAAQRWIENSNSPLNLHIKNSDALTFLLSQEPPKFDVYYIDPMFSHARSALPKKEMQYLAELSDEFADAHNAPKSMEIYWEQVFSLLNSKAQRPCRIVVKRARQAGALTSHTPSHSLQSKMLRFDVYNLSATGNGIVPRAKS